MDAGATLGHYRILSPLGAGGMGEVYVAEDSKLHRRVALKVLPALLASDDERRKRFEREARAVAALNHPGIVTIYSVEEEAGVPFLTMELVEGQPLKDTIPRNGATLEMLLRVGLAVSEAVAFAHQHGIIHRDLKPANVMVTAEGRVKVLDFGLAKLHEAGPALATEASTRMIRDDLTNEGRIVGTVSYMSPEQAEGRPVDHRSDIFSLGVLLHEMATGERPFKGDTDISVISAILKDNPASVSDVRPDLPAAFTRIVRRCLAKDPLRRYQSAQDLHNDLDELKQDITSGIAVPPRSARRTRTYAAAALLAIAAAGAALWLVLPRFRSGPYLFVPDRFLRLTDTGTAFMAKLSPDGRYVVHAKRENRQVSLWVRQTGTTSDVRIVSPSDARFDGASFSNDGTFVYYVTYPRESGVGTLYKVPALGGTPLRVLEDVDSAPSFSPDGSQFSFMRGEPAKTIMALMVANTDGSGVRRVAESSPPAMFLAEPAPWSPDGKRVVAAENTATNGVFRARLQVVDVQSGTMTTFGGEWEYVGLVEWMPDGRSVAMSAIDAPQGEPQIWQVMYPSGERQRITSGLNAYQGVSVADGGRTLATIESQRRSNIWTYPLAGGSPRQITTARGTGGGGMAWTHDGRLVYTKWTADAANQLWIMAADGSNASQLTTGAGFAALPAVSPDGAWLYYNGDPATTNASAIFRMPVAGGVPQRISPGPADHRAKISPDGKWIFYLSSADGRVRTMKVSAEGGTPVALGSPDRRFFLMAISLDGLRLLGTSWNAERRRSQPAFLSTTDGTIEFRDDIPTGAIWMPDGKSWLYPDPRGTPPGLYVKPIAGGTPRLVADLGDDQSWGVAVAPDGKQLAVLRGQQTVDVVLIRAK